MHQYLRRNQIMEEHGNTKGTYHLHGNNGNPNGSHSNFRKYGLLFEAMQFFYYFSLLS